MSAESIRGPRRLYRQALAWRGLVHLVQFAVTGEWTPRRHRLIAGALAAEPDAFVLDLGCGAALLLRYVSPRRYVGIDEHAPSLNQARRRRGGLAREFVLAPLSDVDLAPWRGADTVVLSSVCHHLSEPELLRVMNRITIEVDPRRILVQEAAPTGVLGVVARLLDDGRHMRTEEELISLFEPQFHVRRLWTYANPVRSFRQFLLELRIAGVT